MRAPPAEDTTAVTLAAVSAVAGFMSSGLPAVTRSVKRPSGWARPLASRPSQSKVWVPAATLRRVVLDTALPAASTTE